jgi:hypothetical protein
VNWNHSTRAWLVDAIATQQRKPACEKQVVVKMRRAATHNPVRTAPTKKPRGNAAFWQRLLEGDLTQG